MNNEQSSTSMPTEDSPIDWPYVCPNCERGFDASMARQIAIVSDTEAELMCSWCRHTATYDAPDAEKIERPPGIVDHAIVTTDHDLTTARLFFEGGAWLQYREDADDWVYEEMFNADGEQIESFKPEFEVENCDPATAYLHRMKTRYERLTVRGLQRQFPHIYAVLIDGH